MKPLKFSIKGLLLCLALVEFTAANAQVTKFEKGANTIILNDSSISLNNVADMLFKNGFLLTNQTDNILVTNHKRAINNGYISMVINKRDRKIYIQSYLTDSYSYYGSRTYLIAYASFRKEFEYVFQIFKDEFPNAIIEAQQL